MNSMQHPTGTVVCLQKVPAPSADSPALRHQEPAAAVPLNLLAGDTVNSSDLVLPIPNKKELLLMCKICGFNPLLRKCIL